ncbi:ImmA/IrrE family metallo-endopeptidase [Tautonia rosea]|uniref:ImmA/IrrE family metallo-endopeptidase n=1 Tax=Tautonia rosea TaxID=2728037 RepID=UPI001473BFD4|nr:ImmA/IrrE family metallo-endopeptidase [Tautonia rosea]
MIKADEVRDKFDISPESAVNVFDLCGERFEPRIIIRFTDIKSMEGLYLRQTPPEIWLGDRPLVRRVFNCAHELGHHVFGHGSTVDELTAEGESGRSFEPNEFLVDTFAGFLLMPRIAVLNAFARRAWKIEDANPQQFFVVSCSLGVGFETLASHSFFSLGLIGEAAYRQLINKPGLPAIRKVMLGDLAPARLLAVDTHQTLQSIDTEVGTGVLLPMGTVAEGKVLGDGVDTPRGRLFTAAAPGTARVFCPDGSWAAFIRVMQDKYHGLSQYRHFPREEGDEDDE